MLNEVQESQRVENVARFKELLESVKTRGNVPRLMAWLDSCDFYTAPASTRYHNAISGGLVDHSLNVYDNLLAVNEAFNLKLDPDSMKLCALTHDICKANFYKPGFRNVKDDRTGKWERVESWDIDEKVPLGHGEKSVIILLTLGISLNTAEMYAIRWHMGGYDNAVKGGERGISSAYEKAPLAVALHMADLAATYLTEERG